jgi:hypothetical protein
LKNTGKSLFKPFKRVGFQFSPGNIEIIESNNDVSAKDTICQYSMDAGLTLIGFREEQLKTLRPGF